MKMAAIGGEEGGVEVEKKWWWPAEAGGGRRRLKVEKMKVIRVRGSQTCAQRLTELDLRGLTASDST